MHGRYGPTAAILLSGVLILALSPRITAADPSNAPLTTEEILSGTKQTNGTDKTDPALVTGETELTKKVLDGPLLAGSSRFDTILEPAKKPKQPTGSDPKPPVAGAISEPGTAGLLVAGTFGLLVLGRRKVL